MIVCEKKASKKTMRTNNVTTTITAKPAATNMKSISSILPSISVMKCMEAISFCIQ